MHQIDRRLKNYRAANDWHVREVYIGKVQVVYRKELFLLAIKRKLASLSACTSGMLSAAAASTASLDDQR
jgi:hypothetical protein